MLTIEDVQKIAGLARLQISPDEVEKYRERLGRILGYVEELSQAPTDMEMTVRHVPKDAVSMREDRAFPFENYSDLLKNAPATDGDSYLLPPVMD